MSAQPRFCVRWHCHRPPSRQTSSGKRYQALEQFFIFLSPLPMPQQLAARAPACATCAMKVEALLRANLDTIPPPAASDQHLAVRIGASSPSALELSAEIVSSYLHEIRFVVCRVPFFIIHAIENSGNVPARARSTPSGQNVFCCLISWAIFLLTVVT